MTVLSSPQRLGAYATKIEISGSLALLLVLDYWYGWWRDKTSQRVLWWHSIVII